jgi:UDP-N-acetylmuramoyl-tripeptide--D-alanyl-D-alanine ligase
MTIQELHTLFLQYPQLSTDTRAINIDSIFFALKGDNFDGNKFAKDAIEKGAKFAVISDYNYKLNESYILVKDTLKTLQALAKYHRDQLNIPIIGITGSNGKTTTKELIKSALSQKYKTFATHGNLNNNIGVPLSLLSINEKHEIAIIEMGANHQKEIEFLVNICNPDCGLITNIGKAHLEGFGGIEGVEKGKVELFQNLSSRNKQIFINVDDLRLKNYVEQMKAITYGTNNCEYKGEITSNTPFLSVNVKYGNHEFEINSNLIGTYNFNNILSAVVLGDYFDVSPVQIKKGIESYQPINNRSQLVRQGSNKIIMDAYNANPSSMAEAINNLVKSQAENKFFVLGDMLELGVESEFEHKNIIELLQKENLKGILVGKEFTKYNTSEYPIFDTNQEAKDYLKLNKKENTLYLIKGSRGIKLETVQEVL